MVPVEGEAITALGVMSDGEDTLVLVDEAEGARGARVAVDFRGAEEDLALERRSQTVWDVGGPAAETFTTIAAREAGGRRVVRVPGLPPATRWSATVDGSPVPGQGQAPVAVLPRMRDALGSRAVLWLSAAALLTALVAAGSATARSVRVSLRAVLFSVLLLVGPPVLVPALAGRLCATGWSRDFPTAEPAALWAAMAVVVPLLAWGLTTLASGTRDARPGAHETPSPRTRLAGALLAAGLVLLLALLADSVAARWFPGLTL
jgi:hypothetical protein